MVNLIGTAPTSNKKDQPTQFQTMLSLNHLN